MYLPQIGLSMIVAWGAADLTKRWRRRPLASAALAGTVLALLAGYAWRQTSYWCDSLTLWDHALACNSHNDFAHYSLGVALDDQGKADQAIEHYRQAVEISPRNARAHNNLGIDLYEKKERPKRSSTTNWPSNSIPSAPRPTAIWGSPCSTRAKRIRRSSLSRRHWTSTPMSR